MTQYARGATRPDLRFWAFDDHGALINFSSGYTFTVRVGYRGLPGLLEKTTGITGQVGSGYRDSTDGVPNIVITWTAGELNIAPGEYTLQLVADAGGGNPRYFFDDIEILDVVLAP